MRARTWVFGAFAVAWAVSAGCTNSTDLAGRVAESDGGQSSFTNADASSSGLPDGSLTQYCPSSKCSDPYTTCPGSRYRCDVNLSNDPRNCGACGVLCPEDRVLGGLFQCVGGKCALQCATRSADCDGIPDNGCEATLGNNDSCGACGEKCTDPDAPCIWNSNTKTGRCGCAPGLTYCSNGFPEYCRNLQTDDKNCGACGRPCGTGSDAAAPPPHAHYGCLESECGRLKCDSGFDDCNSDLGMAGGNGCETNLVTEASCGGCGVACDPGQVCVVDYLTKLPTCKCEKGKFNCGTAESPNCVDIFSDQFNCGGCGIWCGLYYISTGLTLTHFAPACNAGSCTFECEGGWADCDGRLDNGCEVNTNSDPNHCGGCGKVCDAVGEQACVAGQCALEPCVTDGGFAR